ncbi:MAG: type II toxin-antitoxin system RelE/ParE family toxin [Saprospiraceae bacterium]|nr:type II toxin-antitoxin system RelE/ParE family toxin [Saprospiraceae bacterium]
MGQTYQVILTPGAQNDIRNIYDYLMENASYESAERVRLGIEEEMINLADMPESKGLLQGTTSQTVYRRVLKWSYRIIFTIEEAELRVLVVRIDHEKMDPAGLENLP